MSHDNDMRKQPPAGFATYRGNGVNITMLCSKCRLPKQQLGSKRIRIRGVSMAVCKQCVAEMDQPKEGA